MQAPRIRPMTSVALARKWRPKSFASLVGQDHVVRALTHALDHDRLHHAYLFTGTRGVGKTTVSRILAKALNCTGPDGQGGVTSQPCGVCPACTEIDAGRFVDYIELDAASNRGVEDMTTLLEQAVYKPTAGRFKVYMIDEVHMLSNHAFNAMLKTLEEPPDYVKFVLATTDPQKVPVTVLSRCLQFNLKQMMPGAIVGHLQQVLQAENVPADDAALRLIARAAHGSMRDALSLTDQALAYCAGRVETEAVQQMLGTVDRSDLLLILQALATQDGVALIHQADALEARGLSFGAALEELAALLQTIALLQLVPQAADADDPQHEALVALAAQLSPELVQLAYTTVLHGRNELSLAPDDRTGFTMTLLRLLAFAPVIAGSVPSLPPGGLALPKAAAPASPPSQSAAAQVAAQREQPATKSAPPVQTAAKAMPRTAATLSAPLAPAAPVLAAEEAPATSYAAKPEPQTPPQPTSSPRPADIKPPLQITPDTDWPALVQRLEVPAGLPRALAQQSELVAMQGTEWLLRVPNEQLTRAGSLDKLQTAVRLALGQDIVLRAEAGEVTDSVMQRDARAKAQAQADAEAAIRNDPLVQQLMHDLGAQIVPGSLKPMPPSAQPTSA
ncbi:putative DNA polymerase III subunit tau [Thiomonas arsenitoxydans]|uniref:DNA polymerase III subunit gamma/tau n=2 Tax=Thiomonas arsenitoxydans (strain DSM 22701 / CIP 110005 / 3As) TaxID=426114 RepID=A0ABM9T313_THIA3|nr:putative DNA polymerase III subunit tau [Thiomonas arsenitoxydans]CQR34990.1 putative DNA polymerase III subunit tau [Thiomonas arsenitoxydans]CQR35844.1 putative DNA polymerase III subunit tau [Thiomonas arsenitoxydans]CQR35938.1 putative DNA polymerase III subunit tau [Thiomonas arsenitoxydans]